MTDDGMPGVGEALDEALMETHHLANLSDLDEARLARRRLVEAQSASSVALTRDRLEQAMEYLELARIERRDTAAGFVQARELVSYAEAGLRRERPVPLTGSPLDIVRSEPESETRRTLQELRADAAVNSFDQLRYDVTLEETFRTLQRQVNAGEIDHEPADDGDLDPDAALRIAGLEIDIERSLQRSGDDSEFDFVADDDLELPDATDGSVDETDASSDVTDAPVESEGARDEGVADVDGEEVADGQDVEAADVRADAVADAADEGVVDIEDEEVAEVLDEAADVLDEMVDVAVEGDGDVPDEIEIPDFDVEAPADDGGTSVADDGGTSAADDGGTSAAGEETGNDDNEALDDSVEPQAEEPTGAGETEDQVARPRER